MTGVDLATQCSKAPGGERREGCGDRLRRGRLAVRGGARAARRRRGLGLRPLDAAHVDGDQRERAADLGRRRASSAGSARRPTRPSCPPATSGSSRSRACTPIGAMADDGARLRRRRRLLRAERRRQRGAGRRARPRGDPRHDLPGRAHRRARATSAGTRRATRTSARSSRARRRWTRCEALADACTRGGHADACARGRARRAVAQADLQRRLERDRRADRAHARAVAEPPTRDLAWAVMAEGRAGRGRAGDHAGHEPGGAVRPRRAQGVAYDHKPSMLQDVEAGRRDGDRLPERRDRRLRRALRRRRAAQPRADRARSRDWRGATDDDADVAGRDRAAVRRGTRQPRRRTASTRSSSPARSTRASRARSATSRASASSTATPTSSCRSTASRRSSSRARLAGSATTARRGSRTRSSPSTPAVDRRPGA